MNLKEVHLVKTIFSPDDIDDPGFPQVAVVGRSNVGKSSLINRVLGRRRLARISRTPGRTRSINYYLVNGTFIIADLPGYGFAKVSVSERRSWKVLVDRYFNTVRGIRAVLLLVDPKRGMEDEEEAILDFLPQKGIRPIVVFTKVDRLNQKDRAHVHKKAGEDVKGLTGREPIYFSARTGEGKNTIISSILELI